ncbi:disks large homolog 1 isoform X22 [Tachysurus ichikawai]
MNYIFGNSTLYPRGGRANTGTAHSAPGSKQRQWAKRSSSEELPSSSSRWQQLLTFFTRRNAFSDCITAGAGQAQPLEQRVVGCVGRSFAQL